MEAADFGGYATKAGLKCSDGRTIMPDAFKHMDKMTVPLVWQHGHNTPENVLGHVVLENRIDGVYAYGFFNDTPQGINAKKLVIHKDIRALSIWANQLVEKAKQVFHGMIREVSLVLSGANPGAVIDYVTIAHSDGGYDTSTEEAIIYTGLEFEHASTDDSGPTVQEIWDTLTDQQKNVVHFMISAALQSNDTTHSDDDKGTSQETNTEQTVEEEKSSEGSADEGSADETTTTIEGDLNHQEGTTVVTRNVFEQNDTGGKQEERVYISHDAMKGIVASAVKCGSLREAVQDYALAHGIENIDLLFPDAKSLEARPDFDKRRTEWVAGVINGTRHVPFSRIKSLTADLTFEEARAKGYIKGTLKKEQFFGVSKRVTTPTTVYKKQKLDRDDIIDITDFDVVAWIKFEMRMMLDEELARAILIGDGRAVDDEDKIKDPVGATEGAGIRSIANDHDLYVATIFVNLDDASSTYDELVTAIITARRFYKGTGTPTFYTTETILTNLLLLKDTTNRRLFRNVEELANELRVAAIVPVEVMEDEADLLGIIVNLGDYAVGTDKGGEVNLFDDFDIDYNQFKYLIEARASGALTKIRSALVLRKVPGSAALVTPAAPTQDDDEVTIVTTTGATYKIGAFEGAVTYNALAVTVGQTVTASFPIVLPDGGSVTVVAEPTSASYYFANDVEDTWRFDYDAA